MILLKAAISFIALSIVSSSWAQDLYGLENSFEFEVVPVNLEDSNEPDIKNARAKGHLNPNSTAHSLVNFTDATGAKWSLQVFQNLDKPDGPTFFVPHDNENEAFETGAYAISAFGGHLIAWECGENRTCDKGIDPNRHFTAENLLYVETVMRFYQAKNFPVITLHNNHDSHHLLGGQGSIYADMEEPYTDGSGFYYHGDPDDLIIYADNYSRNESSIFRFYQSEFERLNINSIYEFIRSDGDLGGHMSTYVLKNAGREYFNIEAQHGSGASQKRLLSQLMDILGVF